MTDPRLERIAEVVDDYFRDQCGGPAAPWAELEDEEKAEAIDHAQRILDIVDEGQRVSVFFEADELRDLLDPSFGCAVIDHADYSVQEPEVHAILLIQTTGESK